MTKETMPNYAELDGVLSKTAHKMHPSQVHGLMCGLLCGQSEPQTQAQQSWQELVTGDAEQGKADEILQDLYNKTATQLKEFLFEFQLVVPDDAHELFVRAEALSLWCQGFLTGLNLAKVQILALKPSEMKEAINDLLEIAKMDYERVVANEEDEVAYEELIEYVRMAVVLIYEDMHADDEQQNAAGVSRHLH